MILSGTKYSANINIITNKMAKFINKKNNHLKTQMN